MDSVRGWSRNDLRDRRSVPGRRALRAPRARGLALDASCRARFRRGDASVRSRPRDDPAADVLGRHAGAERGGKSSSARREHGRADGSAARVADRRQRLGRRVPARLAEIARELPFAKTISLPALESGRRFAAHRSSRRSRRASPRSTRVPTSSSSSTPTCPSRRTSSSDSCGRSSRRALGIAGGTCYEQDTAGEWRPTFATRDHVRGATRAYRAACFEHVTPLEQRMGWDGIDELKAQVAGWKTRSLPDLPFRPPPRPRSPRAIVVEVGRSGRHGALHGVPLRLPPRPNRVPAHSRARGRGHGVGLPDAAVPPAGRYADPRCATTFDSSRAWRRSHGGSARPWAGAIGSEVPLSRTSMRVGH